MIYAINAKLFVDSETTPDDIGHTFEAGAVSVMSEFPVGDIISVDVESVVKLSDEEIAERGFEE
jgi:hypothetical protein